MHITAGGRACLDGTQFFPREALEEIRREVLASDTEGFERAVEVVNETMLAGIGLLADGGEPVTALNFESANNPGAAFWRAATYAVPGQVISSAVVFGL